MTACPGRSAATVAASGCPIDDQHVRGLAQLVGVQDGRAGLLVRRVGKPRRRAGAALDEHVDVERLQPGDRLGDQRDPPFARGGSP